jgi:hypothetical protein
MPLSSHPLSYFQSQAAWVLAIPEDGKFIAHAEEVCWDDGDEG